ncbi:unnamed protein product, partial [marine sediment metagenome]
MNFYVEREYGEDIFMIFIEDDGNGMDKKELLRIILNVSKGR